jgi:hypothetical protein
VYCEGDAAGVEPWLNICRNLRIEAAPIGGGGNPAASVVEYARAHGITQIFVTRDAPALGPMMRLMTEMQVTVVRTYRNGAEV